MYTSSAISAVRPKLLFLCQTLPYPPDGGVNIRSFNILRLLSERYDVTALCFVRSSMRRDVPASLKALAQFALVEAFPIEQESSKVRLIRDHIRSVVTRRVYSVAAYSSEQFRARLRSEVATGRYELVHMDSLDLSGYLDDVGSIPVVCVHHNVESELLRRRADVEKSRLRRLYLRFQSRLMLTEERRWCPKLAMNVVVSPEDGATLSLLAPGAPVMLVPNGVDTKAFRPVQTDVGGVVFVGGMTWFPNRDALEYFSSDIMPLLRGTENPVPSVTWVGRATAGADAEYAKRGVTLTGYVDDVKPYIARAACYVVPLRVGGGTRLKILDAWAMGKAVVSTSIGCEGLQARDGWNILIRNDPREFAIAVREILADDALRERLGRNARDTAEGTYSWEGIGRSMLPRYESLRLGDRLDAVEEWTDTAIQRAV